MNLRAVARPLPPGVGLAEVVAACRKMGRVDPRPERPARRLYLDTFDGRVRRAGWRLWEEGPTQHRQTVLVDAPTGRRLGRVDGGGRRFGPEFPPGALGDRLRGVLAMRALLPLVRVEGTESPVDVRNRDDKRVLRFVIESLCASAVSREGSVPLGRRLRVEPVRGYAKALDRFRKAVGGLGLGEPVAADPCDAALRALGLVPPRVTSKIRVPLAPGMPAGDAVRAVLLHLLDTLQANEDGTRSNLDSEFLHDFRVAVRRTRAALGQLKNVLPSTPVARFREGFAWLGRLTGPLRDLDVYLLEFPNLAGRVPDGEDLAPLHRFLLEKQRSEHRKLVRSLDTRRYRGLMADWRRFLETPPGSDWPEAAGTAVEAVAGRRIWKVYRRAVEEGRAIHGGSPDEALHDLRKTCKKLRYLLEFFQSLYGARRVRGLIGALKGLQDNLGTFNDLCVQAETLPRFGEEMVQGGAVPPATLLAMGALVESLRHSRLTVRAEFHERFSIFAASDTRKRYRELFRPGATENFTAKNRKVTKKGHSGAGCGDGALER